MPDFRTVPCRGCGVPMIWPHDSKVPIDARSEIITAIVIQHPDLGKVELPVKDVYVLEPDEVGRPVLKKPGPLYVSHFRTCSSASRFSKAKEKADGEDARA